MERELLRNEITKIKKQLNSSETIIENQRVEILKLLRISCVIASIIILLLIVLIIYVFRLLINYLKCISMLLIITYLLLDY